MSYLLARVTDDWMTRGANYELTVCIEDYLSGEDYDLTGKEVKMYLMDSYTYAEALLEKTGSGGSVDLLEGRIKFDLIPEDTKDLRLGGFDLIVTVDGTTAFQGRFGIYPGKPYGGD